MRVRYEDLVTDTVEVLARIYKHLKIEFTKAVLDVAFLHAHADNRTGTYYDTFRNSDFVHDSWKKELNVKNIRNIEAECERFMQIHGYLPYDDEKKK